VEIGGESQSHLVVPRRQVVVDASRFSFDISGRPSTGDAGGHEETEGI
jgi:hypothetical protein